MTKKTAEAQIKFTAKDETKSAFSNIKKQLIGIGAAYAALKVAKGIFSELSTATQVAARIQVLNRVFKMTGIQAGHTAKELAAAKTAIMDLGIAEQEALQIGQRFIQAQLDLADATLVARAAQDLAVIAGTNSSETALQLTEAIVKQRPILLKQFGIIADLTEIYGQQAEALGKTREELTKNDKRQAFLNEILRQSKTVAGAYTSAMQDVGKRLTSLPRHLQSARNAIGTHFLPVMGLAIDSAENFLKAITAAFSPDLAPLLKAQRKFDKSSESTLKLADRYDELTAKTKLTNIEQKELNAILVTFQSESPGVITAWDNMGNAISANTGALRDNLEAERSLIALRMKEELIDLGESFRETTEALKTTASNLNDLVAPVWTVQQGFRTIKRNLSGLITDLQTYREEQKAQVNEAMLAFPNLIEGTERYTFAVRTLGQEFVDMIVKAKATMEGFGTNTEMVTTQVTNSLEIQMESAKRFFDLFIELDDKAAKNSTAHIQAQAGAKQRLFDDLRKGHLKLARQVNKVWEDSVNARIAAEAEWARFAASRIGEVTGTMATNLLDLKNATTDTWRAMADDFKRLFLDLLITSTAPGGEFVKSFLGNFSFWDVAANDRALVREGQRAAMFIKQGMQQGISGFVPDLGMAAAGMGQSGGGGITINFNAPVTNREFVENEIVPMIEDAVLQGRSQLSIDTNSITGIAPVR